MGILFVVGNFFCHGKTVLPMAKFFCQTVNFCQQSFFVHHCFVCSPLFCRRSRKLWMILQLPSSWRWLKDWRPLCHRGHKAGVQALNDNLRVCNDSMFVFWSRTQKQIEPFRCCNVMWNQSDFSWCIVQNGKLANLPVAIGLRTQRHQVKKIGLIGWIN